MIKIGVIGYGYWGPNIVRNFHSKEGSEVVSVCDSNAASLGLAKKRYPNLEVIHLTVDTRKDAPEDWYIIGQETRK